MFQRSRAVTSLLLAVVLAVGTLAVASAVWGGRAYASQKTAAHGVAAPLPAATKTSNISTNPGPAGVVSGSSGPRVGSGLPTTGGASPRPTQPLWPLLILGLLAFVAGAVVHRHRRA